MCVLIPSLVSAQANITYDDVAVIVNINSPGSIVIGNYFMAARNIPSNRLISVEVPLSTSILPEEFALIRATIEDHLIGNGLVDSINYIVTTLGVPIRVDNGTCDSLSFGQFSKCSSVDTELALILGPHAASIVTNGYVMNPYMGSNSHQAHATSGIYLVTRLAGPSVQDVIDLIDRSGPGLPVDPTTALMAVDINNPDTMPGVQQFWNAAAQAVIVPATNLGIDVSADYTSLFLDDLSNVVGYVSLTSGLEPFLPTFDWAPGSMAVEWYSHSALHYDTPGPYPGYNRISEWIGHGASCAIGTVGITYASPWGNTRLSFERYLDTAFHFNAAESMYASIPWLSWIYDAVGDPKTSIIWSGPMPVTEHATSAALALFPNPSQGEFSMRISMDRIAGINVFDGLGRTVPSTVTNAGGSVSIKLLDAPTGLYNVVVSTRSGEVLTARALVGP